MGLVAQEYEQHRFHRKLLFALLLVFLWAWVTISAVLVEDLIESI